LIVAPGASVDLVGAIRHLQSASSEREAMGETARRLAVGRYSAGTAHRRWAAVLARVVEPALLEARS
jgi:hypothetical protein